MKNTNNKLSARSRWGLLLLLSILSPQLAVFGQPTTVFTYQGRLTDGGGPATGSYDLRFTLFDAETGGNTVGSAITTNGVSVSSGLFTVTLDFGDTPFTAGADRWLEIAGRTNGTPDFGTLNPRQRITSTPYAITAKNVSGLVPATQISGTLNTAQVPSLDASKITTGTFGSARIPSLDASKINAGIFDSARVPDLDAAKINSGTLLDGRLSANVALLNRNPQTFTGENSFANDVGIGTTSPNSRLHVNGDGVTPSLRVQINGTSKLIVHANGGTSIGTNTVPPANGLYVADDATVGGLFTLQSSLVVPAAGGTLTPTRSYLRLNPSANVTLNSTTAITNGTAIGNILILENISANTVTVPNNAKTVLTSDRVLNQYSVLTLIWDGNNWVLLSIRLN